MYRLFLTLVALFFGLTDGRTAHNTAIVYNSQLAASLMFIEHMDSDDVRECIEGLPMTNDYYKLLHECKDAEVPKVYLNKKNLHYVVCTAPTNMKQKKDLRKASSTNPELWELEYTSNQGFSFSGFKDAVAYVTKQYENVDHNQNQNQNEENENTLDDCYDGYGRRSDVLDDVNGCIFMHSDFDDGKNGFRGHVYVPRRTSDLLKLLTSMPKDVGFGISDEMKDHIFKPENRDIVKDQICYIRAEKQGRVILCLHAPSTHSFRPHMDKYSMCVNGEETLKHSMRYYQGEALRNLNDSLMFRAEWTTMPVNTTIFQFSEKCQLSLTIKPKIKGDEKIEVEAIMFGASRARCPGQPYDVDQGVSPEHFLSTARNVISNYCYKLDTIVENEIQMCLVGSSKTFFHLMVENLEILSKLSIFKNCNYQSKSDNCTFFYSRTNGAIYPLPNANILFDYSLVGSKSVNYNNYECYLLYTVPNAVKLYNNTCSTTAIGLTEYELMVCECSEPMCDKMKNKISDTHTTLSNKFRCYNSNYNSDELKVVTAHSHSCVATQNITDTKVVKKFMPLKANLLEGMFDERMCLMSSDRYAKGYNFCFTTPKKKNFVLCCCMARHEPCNDPENFRLYLEKPPNPFPGCVIEGVLEDQRCKESADVRAYKSFMCRSVRQGWGDTTSVVHGCELHDRKPRTRRAVICSAPLAHLIRAPEARCYTVALETHDGPPGFDIILCCDPLDFRSNGNQLANRTFSTFEKFV